MNRDGGKECEGDFEGLRRREEHDTERKTAEQQLFFCCNPNLLPNCRERHFMGYFGLFVANP